MVANIDRWLGVLADRLRERGQWGNTLIVYSSDHGEMLGDLNGWGKSKPYQPAIGVPMIVAGPGVAAGGVDLWMVGILPVTLYPFLGGKVWCRFWCPLAKMMQLVSKWSGRAKITANDKCIACGECTRYCQVGINVMNYAMMEKSQ